MSFREEVVAAGRKRILYTRHVLEQMNKPERLIMPAEIKQTVFEGEIIEDYEEDTRGHSCLMLGCGEGGRPVHVLCAPKENYLAVITAYNPNEEEWEEGFKKRKG